MPILKSRRNKSIENPETAPKAASTAYNVGDWLKANGSGALVPLTPTVPVKGLCLETISSASPDYTSTRQIAYDGIADTTDRWLMPVTTGSAAASDIGSTFDVDAGNSYGLDVSGAGTQFEITQVITSTLVEVKVALTQVDN